MGDMQCFFSLLVDNLATEVQLQISGCKQTDQWWQHDDFSWYDWWQQHNATSSGRRWTDQRQRHDSSSLSWLTVWLVMCDGKSACAGGLIDGGNMMLFLGMINSGNTTLLLAGMGGLIDGKDTTLLLLAGWWFGYLCAMVNQHVWANWLTATTQCFFLGMINGGNTALLPLAGRWWEGTLATCLVWQTKFWCIQK